MRTGNRALRLSVALVVAVGMGGLSAATAMPGDAASPPTGVTGPRFTPGADGAGDGYFPFAGNGGYDVQHYDLAIKYTPPAPAPAAIEGQLEGVATITMAATQDLDRFNLDLRGMRVSALTVNGRPAAEIEPPSMGTAVEGAAYWQVQDDDARIWELAVQPRPKIKADQEVVVVVEYSGTTTRPHDIEGFLYGWVTTRDGAMVMGEPEGSMTWYPVSDHPTDKATYSYAVTVPEGKVAVANGLPTRNPETVAGWTTWYWDAPDPQASYLTTASVGDFDLRFSETASGLPIIDAVDWKMTSVNWATTNVSLELQPEMIEVFEDAFGPYPFSSYGSIVDNDSVGYSLATQTRPVYSSRASEGNVAFQLAHQWFGNAVSPQRWQDIWLAKGWAEYSTWLWSEQSGGQTAQEHFDEVMARAADDLYWRMVIGDPGPLGLFSTQVYNRGGATLHALRLKIGDDAFFEGARGWVSRFKDRTATTEDLIALYEEVSGQDLKTFFRVWIYTPGKPTTS